MVLTTISAFSTIVGLLTMFKAEGRADRAATIEEYVQWLRSHQHEQLAHLILDNAELSRSLESLLANQHDEVISKLKELNLMISDVASHLHDFKPIADALAVQSRLSQQAVDILHQLNLAHASTFYALRESRGGVCYPIDDGNQDELTITDPRFIEDDLSMLCELGLLRATDLGVERRRFTITRAGAAVGS